ncbi:MAG: carbon-phosphorus lyase complex subunit PhnI [Syntrophobacterales bacterium]|nr:carbon-phosphorus lyase complex subunit PhnI [Syntrophobacterales bacterium]
MGYVAVSGGLEAIEQSNILFNIERYKGKSRPLEVSQVKEQLYLLVDRVMGEGGLYSPELASIAIIQSGGDTFEASLLLRAHRVTLSRLTTSLPITTERMRVIRRISSAFQEIPGGQILGPTTDYTIRLLQMELLISPEEEWTKYRALLEDANIRLKNIPRSFPKIVKILKEEGLIEEPENQASGEPPFDITKHSLTFPAPRSAILQSLARGETGGLLLLAYSSMRGYGNIHPTLGELRVGYVPLIIAHPHNGNPYTVGEIKVTEAEVISRYETAEGLPRFSMGYGACFGQNEIKAISMAILERCVRTKNPKAPAEDQEFVLSHIDGIESMGFCNHWKLPHYVDFQSDLDRLRKAQNKWRASKKPYEEA